MSSKNLSIGHVSVPAANPRELAVFYSDLLGLEQSMAGSIPQLGDFVFLSRQAEDELPDRSLHGAEIQAHRDRGREPALAQERLRAQ